MRCLTVCLGWCLCENSSNIRDVMSPREPRLHPYGRSKQHVSMGKKRAKWSFFHCSMFPKLSIDLRENMYKYEDNFLLKNLIFKKCQNQGDVSSIIQPCRLFVKNLILFFIKHNNASQGYSEIDRIILLLYSDRNVLQIKGQWD